MCWIFQGEPSNISTTNFTALQGLDGGSDGGMDEGLDGGLDEGPDGRSNHVFELFQANKRY
jgi:hypothetical protein